MTTSVGLVLEVRQKTQGLSQGVRAVDSAGRKMRESATRTQRSMNKMGMSIKSAFAGFVGAAAAVSFLHSAEAATRKFSSSIAELSAITGATGKDLQFLKDSALELGSTTLSSASQVAKAFKLVGSAKASLLDNADALKSVTKEVITLSEASGTSLANAAQVTGSALNQFGLDAEEAGRVVNVLAAGSKFGAAEVDQLGQSLKMVGPVAGSLGLSIEETVSALELLSQAGIKGSEAGTALRAVLIRLSTQANDNFNPTVVGMSQALQNLRSAELDVTESTKLFGQEAIAGGLSLVKFSNQMDTMTEKVTGSKTAMEQAATVADSYAGKVTKLGNAWEGLQVSIGDSLAGGGVIDAATADINNLSSSIREYGLVLGTIKGLTFDPVDQTRRFLQSKVTPDTGDAGITQTDTFESVTGFKRSDIPSVAGEFQKRLNESFVAPIESAGGKLTKFAETAREASSRLQNSFSSNKMLSDPFESAANKVIGNLAEQRSRELQPTVDRLSESGFMDTLNEGTRIANELKFARGKNREFLMHRLENVNSQIDRQGYQSGGSTEQRIKRSLADQFNNFITEQLNQDQRLTVTVNVKPDDDSLVKFVGKAVSKEINDAARSVAN